MKTAIVPKKPKPEPVTVTVFVVVAPDGHVIDATNNEAAANACRRGFNIAFRQGRKRAVIRKATVTV